MNTNYLFDFFFLISDLNTSPRRYSKGNGQRYIFLRGLFFLRVEVARPLRVVGSDHLFPRGRRRDHYVAEEDGVLDALEP